MGDLVRVEKAGGIAKVVIDHPPLNVLSSKVLQELESSISMIEEDPEVVVVMLTGAGNQAFIAGADIKEFSQWFGRDDVKEFAMNFHRVFNRIDDLKKPTIAVLNGLTLGGGCELALTCDIRIIESHVQIGLPEIKLGLFPGGGGTQRLPRLVGEAKAKEIMYSGESISAEEACRIGLVNHVVPSGKGMEAARTLAQTIARNSLQALSRIKTAVDVGVERSFPDALEWEAELFAEVFQTEDVREGVQAFIEKRIPQFQHK